MTVGRHGVHADTDKRIIIDAGAVYWKATDDWTVGSPGYLLGATRGGNVFEINRTIRRMDPDGAKGPVKGFRRLEEVAATLTVNLLEITEENIQMMIGGSDLTAHVITGEEIADEHYITNVVLVGTMSDPALPGTTKPIILKLKNCLCDGPFSLGMAPKEEAVVAVVFTAHFLPTDLVTEPWEITYPSA